MHYSKCQETISSVQQHVCCFNITAKSEFEMKRSLFDNISRRNSARVKSQGEKMQSCQFCFHIIEKGNDFLAVKMHD